MYYAGLIETIITLPIGILFIVTGVLLWKKQKIQWIHDYHRKNVKPEDTPAYTRLWGIALLIVGICSGFTGIIDFVFRTGLGWVLFAAGMAACLFIGNKAQKAYNGSWFS